MYRGQLPATLRLYVKKIGGVARGSGPVVEPLYQAIVVHPKVRFPRICSTINRLTIQKIDTGATFICR